MFGTLPHRPQGHSRSYGQCSAPKCFTKVSLQSWLGAMLWEQSVAHAGLNEIHPGGSNPSLACRRVAKANMLLGLLSMSPGNGRVPVGGGQTPLVLFFIFTRHCIPVWGVEIILATTVTDFDPCTGASRRSAPTYHTAPQLYAESQQSPSEKQPMT